MKHVYQTRIAHIKAIICMLFLHCAPCESTEHVTLSYMHRARRACCNIGLGLKRFVFKSRIRELEALIETYKKNEEIQTKLLTKQYDTIQRQREEIQELLGDSIPEANTDESRVDEKRASSLSTPPTLPTLNDYCGEIPCSLQRALARLKNPRIQEAYTRYRVKKGIRYIFSGPPGTGKTYFAMCFAGELGIPCELLSAPSVINGYIGQTSVAIREKFKEIRTKAANHPSKTGMLIIDEIDIIGGKRSTRGSDGGIDHNYNVTSLLTEIDGINVKNLPTNLIVIGTTNCFEMLDPALTRPGRLDTQISFGPLTRAQDIQEMLARCIHTHQVAINTSELSQIAEKFVGKTTSYIAEFVEEMFQEMIHEISSSETDIREIDIEFLLKHMHKKLQ